MTQTERDEWENNIIGNASYFTTILYHGKAKYDRKKFPTLVEACEHARIIAGSMVFAVTKGGKAAYIPETKWPAVA